jgi:hypothetical protein
VTGNALAFHSSGVDSSAISAWLATGFSFVFHVHLIFIWVAGCYVVMSYGILIFFCLLKRVVRWRSRMTGMSTGFVELWGFVPGIVLPGSGTLFCAVYERLHVDVQASDTTRENQQKKRAIARLKTSALLLPERVAVLKRLASSMATIRARCCFNNEQKA